MKKLKLIMMCFALMLGWSSANAYQTPIANGVYYIQNVKTGKFVNYGWNYGARFFVDDYGTAWKLIADDTNFKIQAIAATDRNFQDDTWMYADVGGDRIRSYTISEVAGQDGVYTMKNTSNSQNVYVYLKEDGDKYFMAGNAIKGDNYDDDDQTYWRFLSQEERDDYIAAKVHENEAAVLAEYGLTLPAETSLSAYLIASEYFKQTTVTVKEMEYWTWTSATPGEASTYNTSIFEVYQGEGTNENKQKVGGTLTAQMTGLTAGLYKVTLPAMYRFGENSACYNNEKTNGYKGLNGGAYFSAGDNPVPLATWASSCTDANTPNWPATFKTIASDGGYQNVTFANVTGNTLDLKVCIPSSIVKGWFVANQATAIRYNLKTLSDASTTFTNGNEASAGKWYKYEVEAGIYQVLSSAASTIKYSQDGTTTVIADIENLKNFIAGGKKYINLSAGTLYFSSSESSTLTISKVTVEFNKSCIIANNGDITSLINGTFDADADGWTGGSRVTGLARSWRSGSDKNAFMERTSNGTMSCTLSDMPAGTYKVVAAARAAAGCTITPQIAGTSGTPLTGAGDTRNENSPASEINLNGVQMPYSSLGGFTTNEWGHNWQWITATGTLASSGDLVINFVANADDKTGNDSWMPIDDVHLYCTNYDETSYTTSLNGISANADVANTGNGGVVTCDIIVTNPNVVFKSNSGAAITTAAEQNLNNCLYQTSAWYMTKMVLYDGYAFEDYRVSHGGYQYFAQADGDNSCTLYRNIPANTWCSLTIPFWPKTTLTKKYPSEFDSETGVLTFSDVTNAACWNNEPMLIKSTSDLTAITGKRAGTSGGGSGVTYGDMTSGEGVPMTGVYSAGTVPVSDSGKIYYALGSDNELHKVTGSGVTINPFRAYFTLNTSGGGAARSAVRMNFGDEITDISEAKAEVKAVKDGKFFKDGKLFIFKNGKKFNAAGQLIY